MIIGLFAGVEGIEPPVAVLETAGLPLTDTPKVLKVLYLASSCFAIKSREEPVNCKVVILNLIQDLSGFRVPPRGLAISWRHKHGMTEN